MFTKSGFILKVSSLKSIKISKSNYNENNLFCSKNYIKNVSNLPQIIKKYHNQIYFIQFKRFIQFLIS
jgi:hypothetical protein